MTWVTPNLSKGDIEILTIALDEYLYEHADGSSESTRMERLLAKLDQHLKDH